MSYVLAGYGLTLVVLVGYALRVVWRERALVRTLAGDRGDERGRRDRWR